MELITKDIAKKAQSQYPLGAELDNQMIVAKFFNPAGAGTWYLMNQDPKNPDYLWGIVELFETEMGSFSLSELQNLKLPFGLHIERDKFFQPISAKKLWEKLVL